MTKKSFYVWQPAEVWYRAEVLADTAEEALSRAKHPSFDGAEWELRFDTVEAVDRPWEVEERN